MPRVTRKCQADRGRHCRVFERHAIVNIGRGEPATDFGHLDFGVEAVDVVRHPRGHIIDARPKRRLTITCGRADLAQQVACTHYPGKLPRVLPPADVVRLHEAAPGPGLKYKAALSVAYGAGLRVADIDSKRMLLRRTPADHRDLPAWRDAEAPAVTVPRHLQDRHVVTTTLNAGWNTAPSCWSSTGVGRPLLEPARIEANQTSRPLSPQPIAANVRCKHAFGHRRLARLSTTSSGRLDTLR